MAFANVDGCCASMLYDRFVSADHPGKRSFSIVEQSPSIYEGTDVSS